MKGTVKWYNARKGYGFITPDDNGDDVFVHATALKISGLKKLYTGSEVTYETDQDEKGRRAKSIKVTKEIKPKLDEKEDTKKKDTKKIDTKKIDTKKKDTKKKDTKKIDTKKIDKKKKDTKKIDTKKKDTKKKKQEKTKKKTKGKTTKGSKKK